MSSQIPSPELAESLGVTGYLLVVVVLAGVGTMAWFLRRMAGAMDRLVDEQRNAPTLLATIAERLVSLDAKVDEAIGLAREHVDAARLWKATELQGRVAREPRRDAP